MIGFSTIGCLTETLAALVAATLARASFFVVISST
jgi:hypothetical protein